MAVAEKELSSERELAPAPWRCSRALFYQMGDLGLFEEQRVILMRGEILHMPPIRPEHQSSNTLTAEAVRKAFGDGYFVREQAPFDIGKDTDPEPDVAVIRGKCGNSRNHIPRRPL